MSHAARARSVAGIGAAALLLACASREPVRARFEVLERTSAAEARQAVAVDAEYFYAIDNRRIGKYRKDTGAKVGAWEGEDGGPVVHLNSGVVEDGLLYAAHSNYPSTPMRSSIEVFDPETMVPVGRHVFGESDGSATWVDRRDGTWWVTFAHYAGRGGVPGKGPADTRLVAFDGDWNRIGEFRYPEAVVRRFAGMSCSGGSWGPDGLLYVTGHDAAEVYALRVPDVMGGGAEIALLEILPVEAEGQGIAWDPVRPRVLYTVLRSRRSVAASLLRPAGHDRRAADPVNPRAPTFVPPRDAPRSEAAPVVARGPRFAVRPWRRNP